jgi:hypothetical protein
MTQILIFTAVDAEGAVRSWARTLDLGDASGRVFFGVPDNPSFPLVVLRRIGGAPDAGDVPLDYPLISFDVWGETKGSASAVATALTTEVQNLRTGTPMGDQAVGKGARVTLGPLWRPDGDAHKARYIVDASFSLMAA